MQVKYSQILLKNPYPNYPLLIRSQQNPQGIIRSSLEDRRTNGIEECSSAMQHYKKLFLFEDIRGPKDRLIISTPTVCKILILCIFDVGMYSTMTFMRTRSC